MNDPAPDWQPESNRLAAASLAEGNPTAWFEELYAAGAAGRVEMPWSPDAPHALLERWTAGRRLDGETLDAGRAIVVGCGLGADAEHLARLGLDTTAFDVAETAIRTARERHPRSAVDYRTADLLDPPPQWRHAFDLVVEIYTIQALPEPPRRRAIAAVGDLVAPGGTLFVAAFADVASELCGDLPPWPLRRDEIEAFADSRLAVVAIEQVPHPTNPGVLLWQAELRAPSG